MSGPLRSREGEVVGVGGSPGAQVDPAALRGFANLHVRSDLSLLQSAASVSAFVARAAELAQPAVAITDLGIVSGFPELQREAESHDLRPIFGLELPLRRRGKRHAGSLVLLAETSVGLATLEQLSTELCLRAPLEGDAATLNGIEFDAIQGRSDGLIALCGGRGTELAHLLSAGAVREARDRLEELRLLFGREALFVQVGPDTSDAGAPREGAAALAAQLGVRLVASAPVSKIEPGGDARAAHTFCAGSRGADAAAGEAFFYDAKDMLEVETLYPGAIGASAEIARRCDATLEVRRRGRAERGSPSASAQLRRLARDGLATRLTDVHEDVDLRLRSELDAIENRHAAEDFLIAAQVAGTAREVGALVGPGRGAAAGSLVCFCVGITDVDPIAHGLLFERLVGGGHGPPYLPLDVDADRHPEVMRAVSSLFGARHAGALTLGRRGPREAVRVASDYLGRDVGWRSELLELVPGFSMHCSSDYLRWHLEREPRLSERYESDAEAREVIDLAVEVEGLVTWLGPHACLHVFAKDDLAGILPLANVKSSSHGIDRVSQYTRRTVEESGLVNLDILGFNDLSILREVQALAAESSAPPIDRIPLDDPDALALLADPPTPLPLFRSRAERQLLRLVRPQSFDELAAVYSLGTRPNATPALERWLGGRSHPESVEYADDRLRSILVETYGTVVYQEQIMRIAQELGGLSPVESDELRRAIGKKKRDEMLRWTDRFVSGAIGLGIGAEAARRTWSEHVLEAVDWAFCKAHAVSYALITYRAAWLCAHHPGAWWTVVHARDPAT